MNDYNRFGSSPVKGYYFEDLLIRNIMTSYPSYIKKENSMKFVEDQYALVLKTEEGKEDLRLLTKQLSYGNFGGRTESYVTDESEAEELAEEAAQHYEVVYLLQLKQIYKKETKTFIE